MGIKRLFQPIKAFLEAQPPHVFLTVLQNCQAELIQLSSELLGSESHTLEQVVSHGLFVVHSKHPHLVHSSKEIREE